MNSYSGACECGLNYDAPVICFPQWGGNCDNCGAPLAHHDRHVIHLSDTTDSGGNKIHHFIHKPSMCEACGVPKIVMNVYCKGIEVTNDFIQLTMKATKP